MLQRSTKNASKQRRELINNEIVQIRDLLPVPESVQGQLSQLQVISLCNAFIGKSNVFAHAMSENSSLGWEDFDFLQLMPGFLIIVTLEGKVLYLSENVSEYLGHSMVNILTRIDTIYDLIENADHKIIKDVLDKGKSGVHLLDEWSFACRMGLTKKLHQSLGITDQKMMQVSGWFKTPAITPNSLNPVFMGLCTPQLNATLASDAGITADTMVYETLHEFSMKYIEISSNGVSHLGYEQGEIRSRSWYEFIHPDDIPRAVTAHKNLIYCESEAKKPLFVRMQTRGGHLIWVCIMLSKIKVSISDSASVDRIVCINQVVREQEAMQEHATGAWKDTIFSLGNDLAHMLPNEDELRMTSSAGKCSSREEVIRRLKRKMILKEIERKRASVSFSDAISAPSLSTEQSNIFNFDISAIQKHSMEDPGWKSCPLIMQEQGSKDESSCSIFSNHSPFSASQSTSDTYSPLPLNTSFQQDEGSSFVASMPTPKFENESYSPGVECILPEDVEVMNVVESLMNRKSFETTSSLSIQEFKGKQPNELPILCPGTVDAFFQEWDGSSVISSADSFLEFEEQLVDGRFTGHQWSAGQTSADPSYAKGMLLGDAAPDIIWAAHHNRRDVELFLKDLTGFVPYGNDWDRDWKCDNRMDTINHLSWDGYVLQA